MLCRLTFSYMMNINLLNKTWINDHTVLRKTFKTWIVPLGRSADVSHQILQRMACRRDPFAAQLAQVAICDFLSLPKSWNLNIAISRLLNPKKQWANIDIRVKIFCRVSFEVLMAEVILFMNFGCTAPATFDIPMVRHFFTRAMHTLSHSLLHK